MVVQNQTTYCDKPNCQVCVNKPKIIDGLVNLDVQALRVAANSTLTKYQGQAYSEQMNSQKMSSNIKFEIKPAPPCPFCNKEFPLRYNASQPKAQEIPKPVGYTYREAESIIEDKYEANHHKQNQEYYQDPNAYYQQGGYNEQHYSNNAYLAQGEEMGYNGEVEIIEENHKSSEELGKEVKMI